MAATLKHDFGGRKVRFIGDCIQGLLAEGTRTETDSSETVREAVRVAAGMRSSFELCQENLPNVNSLCIAIGIEFGTTPITRIGIRGDRSVRCSVSRAVTASEELQSTCGGLETALGLLVVFGTAPSTILPRTYARIEEAVMTRAAELDCSLRGKTDQKSLRKLQLLSNMVKQATARTNRL